MSEFLNSGYLIDTLRYLALGGMILRHFYSEHFNTGALLYA